MSKRRKVVKNEYNTRVPCICQSRTCYIFYRSTCIGELTEEKNDALEFDWVIKIYWDAWHAVGEPPIPGIDTDLRLPEYIRAFLPVIVEQRTLPEDRADVIDEMKRLGMTRYDRFDYMVLNHGLCGNNMLTIGKDKTDYPVGYWDELEKMYEEYYRQQKKG